MPVAGAVILAVARRRSLSRRERRRERQRGGAKQENRGFHEKGSFICFNERAPILRTVLNTGAIERVFMSRRTPVRFTGPAQEFVYSAQVIPKISAWRS